MSQDHAPHPIDLAVGANIRRLRRVRKMSQEALAERIDLTFQQVQKYERGSNRVSCSKLVEICTALECSPVEILPPPEHSKLTGYGDWSGEMAELYHRAPGLMELLANMAMPEVRALTVFLHTFLGHDGEIINLTPADIERSAGPVDLQQVRAA
ncbi:MAG: helix-turn-helix domain-containing protein [Asticcacaulis sp.]|uniref:helix-turn-helix domain-containing protein n=1 Tax=Asticcacaulis sp. TaxID=1872648 RepID=UPI003F7BAA08